MVGQFGQGLTLLWTMGVMSSGVQVIKDQTSFLDFTSTKSGIWEKLDLSMCGYSSTAVHRYQDGQNQTEKDNKRYILIKYLLNKK